MLDRRFKSGGVGLRDRRTEQPAQHHRDTLKLIKLIKRTHDI